MKTAKQNCAKGLLVVQTNGGKYTAFDSSDIKACEMQNFLNSVNVEKKKKKNMNRNTHIYINTLPEEST